MDNRVPRLTTNILVGSICTILLAVTEQSSLYTGLIGTGQVSILAEWFLGVKKRLRFSLLVFKLAVINRVLPIARLLLDVEVKTSRASYSLETGTRALNNVPTVVALACYQSEPFSSLLFLADFVFETLFLFVFLSFHSSEAL